MARHLRVLECHQLARGEEKCAQEVDRDTVDQGQLSTGRYLILLGRARFHLTPHSGTSAARTPAAHLLE